MRKVIYSASISLDGYIETREGNMDWVIVDEELHTFFNDLTREAGAFLYGRRMYELMLAYWPTAEDDPANPAVIKEFSALWKVMPKIVFSKSLDKVEWNSRLVRGDIAAEIEKLKALPGKDLGLSGAILASTLLQLGLIDEYQLFVNPVVLGGGNSLFQQLNETVKLRLIETRTFSSGVVYLRFQPDSINTI